MKKAAIAILLFAILFTSACAPADHSVTTLATTTVPETIQDQGIKNIILVIGDGMGVDQVKAGELVASEPFVFTHWQHTLVDTNSLNGNGEPLNTTDSAASATALATGTLTINGRIGMDTEGTPLKTIMDYAQEYGKATGIITTDKIFGATPSGFSGHARSRDYYEEIMTSQFQSGIDLLCSNYSAEAMENRHVAENVGYVVCDSYYKANKALSAERGYWLLNLANHTATDKLAKVTSLALEFLSKDPDGFVLMVEQANIDGFGHKNSFDGLPQCVNILNDTVAAILDWVGDRKDTAILVTADHETGGLQVSTEPNYKLTYPCADGSLLYYNFTAMVHTNADVDLFVYGFDPDFNRFYTEERPSSIKNTNIFDMMLELLENPLQESN